MENLKKCPYCNADMLSGYIQCRDGVYWCQNKRIVAALPPFQKSIALSNTSNHVDGLLRGFSGYLIEAYNCSKCKKVIICYGDD